MQLIADPRAIARRFSNTELEQRLVESATQAKKASEEHVKLAHIRTTLLLAEEVKERLEAKFPHLRVM